MAYGRSSHSVYDKEYHIVFWTKYRYRVLYGSIAERCVEVIREICSSNYVDIISGNVSPDHVHMLISAPPHLSISTIMQYVKGKSSRKLQYEFREFKKRYWVQQLWLRGYFVSTSWQISMKEVQKYIEEQDEHHKNYAFIMYEF